MFNLKVCPHCKHDSIIVRIQAPDDLNWKSINGTLEELWQCQDCGGYFLVTYNVKEVIPLRAKKGEAKCSVK